jgi:hypothetical protein
MSFIGGVGRQLALLQQYPCYCYNLAGFDENAHLFVHHRTTNDSQATADDDDDDTKAFERAIQLIADNGGGRLVVFPGHYRIRPVNLTSHMILHLRQGVTISAIPHPDQWPIIPPLPSYGRGRDHPGPRYSSLLGGQGLQNVTIQGEGMSSVIDGQGKVWWDRHNAHSGNTTHETITRGHLIEFMYSRHISMYNLTLRNAPFWTNHFYDCDHVHVKNVHVRNAPHSPNTDGWDPDSCRNVLIEDSTYVGGDDCVAIKSGWDCFGVAYNTPSVNITIRNLTCHGKFAGIAVGSEMSGGIENVSIENVIFTRANKPINIKVGNTRGGYVRNVQYRNISVQGIIDQAIHLDAFHYFNHPNPACPQGWHPPAPVVSNISIQDIDGSKAKIQGGEVFHFVGLPNQPFESLYMENVHFPKPLNAVSWNCSSIVNAWVKDKSVSPWPPCSQFHIVKEQPIHYIFLKNLKTQSYGHLIWALLFLLVTLVRTSRIGKSQSLSVYGRSKR